MLRPFQACFAFKLSTVLRPYSAVWSGGLSPALVAAQALLRLPQSEFKSLVLEIGSKSTLVVSTAMLSVAGALDVRLTLRSRIGPESAVRLREQYELTGMSAPTLLALDGAATAEDLWLRVKGRQFLDANLPSFGPFADEAVKFLGGATQPLLGWAGEDGVKLPLSGLYERVLYISYMDDDMVIARDVGGAPSVLVRKAEEYLLPYAAVEAAAALPSYGDSFELPAAKPKGSSASSGGASGGASGDAARLAEEEALDQLLDHKTR